MLKKNYFQLEWYPGHFPAYWDGNYERPPLFERETAIKVLETAGGATNVHKQGDYLYATLDGHELHPDGKNRLSQKGPTEGQASYYFILYRS